MPANKKANNNVMDAYLKDYAMLRAEELRNNHQYRDSILMRIPFSVITIENVNGDINKLELYPYKDMFEKGYTTRSVDDITPQIERHFVHTNKGDFFIAQQQFFQKLLKKVDYFY